VEPSTAPGAMARARGEGPLIWTRGGLIEIKATCEDTGGAYGLLEERLPVGFAPPLHVHRGEDEAFYVIEGELRFACGETVYRASAGAFVFLPRGVAHTFRVDGDAPARLLNLMSPGGFEHMFVEDGEPAGAYALPPPGPADPARLAALVTKYRCTIIGPPLVP
jgi:quercetin dioxygenase-like cupin family protein